MRTAQTTSTVSTLGRCLTSYHDRIISLAFLARSWWHLASRRCCTPYSSTMLLHAGVSLRPHDAFLLEKNSISKSADRRCEKSPCRAAVDHRRHVEFHCNTEYGGHAGQLLPSREHHCLGPVMLHRHGHRHADWHEICCFACIRSR